MLALTIVLLLMVVTPQEKPGEPQKEPKRGDTLVVRGCITGGTIESSDAETNDSTGTHRGFVTYRLTGDKKALKQIKQEHDGHVDILTGILKSDLPQQNTPRGKRVGNTRITVGVGAQPTHDPNSVQYLPVLQVKELEHTDVTCRR
jgi:hypothetical protein